MKLRSLVMLAGLLPFASPASAAVTFEYLFTGGYPLSVSHDGTVIVGNNTTDYGAFRWTQATGRVELGRAALPVMGNTGGTTSCSWNGSRVTGSIHDVDSTCVTAGLWTIGSGWQQLLPPAPPWAKIIDVSLASSWGMSGDGNTIVGLIWLQTGRAHAFTWRANTGIIDLPTPGGNTKSSRANCTNFDGTIVGGWTTNVVTGEWQPAVWNHGQHQLLSPSTGHGEVRAISTGGDFLVGHQRDVDEGTFYYRELAMWTRQGDHYGPTQLLGKLPGTEPPPGINTGRGVATDGSFVIGYCSWGGDPFSTTGLVWSPSTGIKDVVDYLGENGVLIDQGFIINDLTCMTPDGSKIVGYGKDLAPPYTVRAFMIHRDIPSVGVVDAAPSVRPDFKATPNPIREGTTLAFNAAVSAPATLAIYNATGRLVTRLLDGTVAAGHHEVSWDRRDNGGQRVAAGVYYSRLEVGGQLESRKLVVLE